MIYIDYVEHADKSWTATPLQMPIVVSGFSSKKEAEEHVKKVIQLYINCLQNDLNDNIIEDNSVKHYNKNDI